MEANEQDWAHGRQWNTRYNEGNRGAYLPVAISGQQAGKACRLWVEQVTPVLMEMAQETRGDGVQRGVLILGPGKFQIQLTVTRVANEDISKPVVPQVVAADLLQITPGDS